VTTTRPREEQPRPDGSPSPDGGAPAAGRRDRWEDWVGAAVLALLALITFANVIARYFTDQSFAWTEEISVSLMVVLTLVGASGAVVRDRHIRVEIVYAGGTRARRRALGLLTALATAVAFAILAALGGRLAWDDYLYEVTSPGIGVPQWWYTAMLPLLCAVIIVRALQYFAAVWKDR
jgi:TRAP-type C4-dicarboxylate transport system permease small subunit